VPLAAILPTPKIIRRNSLIEIGVAVTSISQEKRQLRKAILAKRRSFSKDRIKDDSIGIANQLFSWPIYQKAQIIMSYVAMAEELQTSLIIADALAKGKTVCVPHIREEYGIMDAAVIVHLNDLVPGKYGILSPDPAKLSIINPGIIELVIVPGVAFDRFGRRLGMGAGYYDRFLAKTANAISIALALSCQIVPTVPCDEYDYSVQYIATKDGIINCNAGKM